MQLRFQKDIMRLPSIFSFAAVVLLIPSSRTAFAQSDPLIGFRDTVTGVDAQGKPTTSVFMMIYDGKFYPTTGVIGYDASAFTRVDDHTVTYIRTLAGKVVATGTRVLSRHGKTLTFTQVTTANGRQNNVIVYDKQ